MTPTIRSSSAEGTVSPDVQPGSSVAEAHEERLLANDGQSKLGSLGVGKRDAGAGLPIAITMGDACGIGPEIVAKVFATGMADDCFVIGDVGVMRRALRAIGVSMPVVQIEAPSDLAVCPSGCLPVLAPPGVPDELLDAPIGQIDARAGAAAARCIEHAVLLARADDVARRIAAIVTAPIPKEALSAAGIGFPGHTEMLQALASPGAKPPPVKMMLANEELRCVLATIHMSLRSAIDRLDFELVLETIRIAHRASALWGQPTPRIGVAGLNPHAGEGGLFGDEELRFIGPAVQAARDEGIDARGPFAPDTVFMRARHTADHPGEFDLVVAMTHDHGLIPVKYLGVEQGVNVTLGLPFVRTSPDHGTAFDIAGQGIADPSSLIAALSMARRLSAAG
jgi:4-hydroxythreonine-4-phosphate dehydrogenase